MPIVDDVSAQMKDAMRAKDKIRLVALRSVRASFIEALKSDGSETLPDDKAITILRKLAKQRKESIDAFDAAGREDLAAQERGELAVLEDFLPSLADEATTTEWVKTAIAESGAQSPADMGRVMGAVMKAHKGDVDGGLTKTIAMRLLSS